MDDGGEQDAGAVAGVLGVGSVLESVWVLQGSATLSTLDRLPLGYRATRDHEALAQLLICD